MAIAMNETVVDLHGAVVLKIFIKAIYSIPLKIRFVGDMEEFSILYRLAGDAQLMER